MTQRIFQFRGINRSLQPNGLDASFAYDAVNVNLVAGKLSNKNVGSEYLVTPNDVPAARPIVFYGPSQKYLILRDKYFELGNGAYMASGGSILGDVNLDGRVTSADAAQVLRYVAGHVDLNAEQLINADVNFDGQVTAADAEIILKDVVGLYAKDKAHEVGPFEPYHTASPLNVVNDASLSIPSLAIRGIGRSIVYAKIDNTDVVLASGMLGSGSGYYEENGRYVNGYANTAAYYLGSETTPKMHVRKFGSGQFMVKDMTISTVNADSGTQIIQSLVTNKTYASLTDADKARAKLDGIFIFSEAIGDNPLEDKLDDAYMWLEVTDVVSDGGNAKFVVNTKRKSSEISANSVAVIRGQCSDQPVTSMAMFGGRLFAATHRANRDHPRRLYWSCLPGDGRTIEDWTQTEVSIDTSGGHTDIGTPYDDYITEILVCGEQLLIFTKTRLWRLTGYAPSNFNLELVGELEGARVSNAVEVNGMVYWMSLAGVMYYNGSYIQDIGDNYSTRYLIDSLPPSIRDSMTVSTVHANMFDNSLMFAFDSNADGSGECLVLRYELETGNVVKYFVPCENFKQQFTDVLKDNFGKTDGVYIKHETRYFQALVHTDGTMTMTQWYDWERQRHGWYGGKKVKSKWTTGFTDFAAPEVVKKPQDVCMRGEGHFTLTLESEVNKETLQVQMPETHAHVRDVSPHVTAGRSICITIEDDEAFEIEPYMTIKYETGAQR